MTGLEVRGVSMFSLTCIYAHVVISRRALCSSDVFVLFVDSIRKIEVLCSTLLANCNLKICGLS